MKKQVCLFLLLVFACAVQVRAEYFTIKHYEVAVTFNADGSADFDEWLTVEYSQPRHGIIRFIPYRDKIDGQTVDRIYRNIKVDGHKFSQSRQNNNVVLKIGDADAYVDGIQEYRIHYKVINPFNFYDEHIEFYWDLLGVSWDTRIDEFEFRLSFPENVSIGPDDVAGYSGAVGSGDSNLRIDVSPRQISGFATKPLLAREGVTVAVRLDKDAFPQRSALEMFWIKHKLILAALVFVMAGVVARFMARNQRQTIMTEYFPPDGVSPAIAGGFVDHSVDNNDVLSLIPHLANHGYLRMEAQPKKGWFGKGNITFYKMKDEGPEMMPFEAQFFRALFASGDAVDLEDLKDRFYTHMAAVKSSVHDWIRLQGWYEADQKAFGCVTGLLGFIAIAWGAFALFALQNMDGIALGVAGFILFFFASRFNKRSPAGNEKYRKLEGFRKFVAKAEKPVIERLRKEDPLYYDKTMPYALAFGYLSQWNRQFDGLLTQPPSWYSSPMMYGTDLTRSWNTFSESFPSEINNIGSVFSSSPGSSSGGGGGFGGGGSSGGGSGGGGGSSW